MGSLLRWSGRGVVVALLLGVVAARTSSAATDPASLIVFSAYPNGAGAPQLFRVQANGEGLRQLTSGQRAATAPSFSPDGKRVVFVRLGSGVYSVTQDGTDLRRLTSGRRDSFPVWSPDGKRVAFLRPYRTEWRVYVMSPTGKGQRRLPLAPPAGRASWSANSKALFVPSAGDLVRIDSRRGRILAYYGLRLDFHVSQAATVSPGGQLVSYVGPRNPTGPEDCGEGPCPQFGLYLSRVPKPHRTRRIANDTGPAGWAPDGQKLVFVSQGALTVMTVAGGARATIDIGQNVAAGDAPPAWQPR